LRQWDLLEERDTQDLENGVQAGLQVEPLLDDGDQDVHGDGRPDLGLHRILGGPVEGLDPQVLLDPLEEELDLPPAFVELGDGQRREREVVGEEHEPLPFLRIEVADAAESLGVAPLAVEAVEPDGLIGVDPGGPVDRARVEVAKPEVPLRVRHEEAQGLVEPVQASEVEVAAIEDIDGASLDDEPIEDVHVVHPPGRDEQHGGDVAPQVQ